jgi:hypothetical protein
VPRARIHSIRVTAAGRGAGPRETAHQEEHDAAAAGGHRKDNGMDKHWHAFSYTGHGRPRDSEARDPESPTPPNVVNLWFRKPRSMMDGTFTEAAAAAEWLRRELTEAPPQDPALSVQLYLRSARDALHRGADAYVGYYTEHGRFLVRALLTCPRRGLPCPSPPV